MKQTKFLTACTVLLLQGCLTQNTQYNCTEYQSYQAAIPYCCDYYNGYCHRTCYRYETRSRCVSAECESGYVWQDVPDAKWWQDKRQCVPE